MLVPRHRPRTGLASYILTEHITIPQVNLCLANQVAIRPPIRQLPHVARIIMFSPVSSQLPNIVCQLSCSGKSVQKHHIQRKRKRIMHPPSP
eukprot:751078-Hanusia_phi.AAC.2